MRPRARGMGALGRRGRSERFCFSSGERGRGKGLRHDGWEWYVYSGLCIQGGAFGVFVLVCFCFVHICYDVNRRC